MGKDVQRLQTAEDHIQRCLSAFTTGFAIFRFRVVF
jgi:hypothetical protein